MYQVGDDQIEIHNDVLNHLQSMNADEAVHDKAFALGVMLSLTSDVSDGIVNQDALNFTIGKKTNMLL